MNLGWAPEFFRNLFGLEGGAAGAKSSEVEIGDRFFQSGMGPSVWTVERICTPEACDLQHVVISRGGPFPDSKVVSAVTLKNTNLYRRERRDPVFSNETENRRRHMDPPIRN
jgi:hypothetical protein